jgi:hypothetical protein
MVTRSPVLAREEVIQIAALKMMQWHFLRSGSQRLQERLAATK